MTTKKYYCDIQCVLGTSVVLVISFFVVLNNYGWKIDSDNWKVLMLFILLFFLNVALPFLHTHGGLFTDTVTIDEEGIVFELRKDTISYKWYELEKALYHCGTGGHTFIVLVRNKQRKIRFTCNKEFKEYFFKIYPNIQ